MKRSKAYRAAAETIDAAQLYTPEEALALAKAGASAKFDETIEVAMRLGVDPRKADQMVRGTVNLPNGTGKTARVLVFATGDRAAAAEEAGADEIGADELIEKVAGGYLDFDAVVATPDLMGKVGKPRPRPRSAWSHAEPEDGHGHDGRRQGRHRHQGRQDRVPRRPARQPPLHRGQGVLRRGQQLAENYFSALDEVMRLKPSAAKGKYLRKITIASTMGPGVPVDTARLKPSTA